MFSPVAPSPPEKPEEYKNVLSDDISSICDCGTENANLKFKSSFRWNISFGSKPEE